MDKNQHLSQLETEELLLTLKSRFEKNMNRHIGINWTDVESKLISGSVPRKLWSLNEMEKTGGEPDLIARDQKSGEYIFYDCSAESPKDRRSTCYDEEALESRKENKPKNSAIGMADAMGIQILSEEEYRYLQKFGNFDTKTSSWIKTPEKIRDLGGAIFADFRYGNVFVYHNGAESYYGSRGFRGSLKIKFNS
jgi:hypothetical protein